MVQRVLTDFHHGSLLTSLVKLFENRLNYQLFRPIGLEWFEQGYWAINASRETAEQYLSLDQAYRPADGTAPLNSLVSELEDNCYWVANPGNFDMHKACQLEYFKTHKFNIVIASIPQHVPLFRQLIKAYNPAAKLILQVGNEWDIDRPEYADMNILASIAPRTTKNNVMFYHQEIDTRIFTYHQPVFSKNVYSFINVYKEKPAAWAEFLTIEDIVEGKAHLQSFGGQCRDGDMHGDVELAKKMAEADLIWHVKPGGDGFGHVLHNAYALGRPVITHAHDYAGKLGGQLLKEGTFINLDGMTEGQAAAEILDILAKPTKLEQMSRKARQTFEDQVDYDAEAERIGKWLKKLH